MKTLSLNGKEYKLAEFDQRLAGEMLKWAITKLPDPLEEIKTVLKDFPPRIQDLMIHEAIQARRMPKSIDHPEIQALFKTPDGMEQVMRLMFQRYNPDLTIEQIWELHEQATKEHGENYIEALPDSSVKPIKKSKTLTFDEALKQSGR